MLPIISKNKVHMTEMSKASAAYQIDFIIVRYDAPR